LNANSCASNFQKDRLLHQGPGCSGNACTDVQIDYHRELHRYSGQEANSLRPQRLVSCISVPGSNEDDWYRMRGNQMTLQLEAVHHRHRDIEDQAGHLRKLVGVQEIAGRVESRGTESDRFQQTLDSLADIHVTARPAPLVQRWAAR